MSTGRLKRLPKVRWVMDCRRLFTGWLKNSPKVMCVIDCGRWSTGWLNHLPSIRDVTEAREAHPLSGDQLIHTLVGR